MLSTDLRPDVTALLRLARLLLDGAIAVERRLQQLDAAGAGETAATDQLVSETDQVPMNGNSGEA